MKYQFIILFTAIALAQSCGNYVSSAPSIGPGIDESKWRIIDTNAVPTPRHEAGFVECAGKLYLLGGRGIKPVDIYDAETDSWSQGIEPPIEVHHFQPVAWQGEIWLVGAMTGSFPGEIPLEHIIIYDPRSDTWREGPEIPIARRRGSSGTVIYEGQLYMVGGIQNGHLDGWVDWFDSYNFVTGEWQQLPNAPQARDHFQAVTVGGMLFVVAGRRSSLGTDQALDITVEEVDVYDFAQEQWSTLPETSNLPTPRAGTSTYALAQDVIVAGGESIATKSAHAEVDALDVVSGQWRTLAPLERGRHGTGIAMSKGALYTCSGSGSQGGSPELGSLERLTLVDSVDPEASRNSLGKFQVDRDLFLAQFDSKTDVDDIQSIAAVATMLADPRFEGVNYHAVAGAYGTQTGLYVPANELFELSFGANWSDAHADYYRALEEVTGLVAKTLKRGGTVWIADAGQSDFSADIVRFVSQALPEIDPKERIHIVQHSEWNEEVTAPHNLAYIKTAASYHKIPNGNAVGNGTPGFRTDEPVAWREQVTGARGLQIWEMATAIANRYNAKDGRYDNTAIGGGGMDFSDVSETCWIFGFDGLVDAEAFFREFTTPPKGFIESDKGPTSHEAPQRPRSPALPTRPGQDTDFGIGSGDVAV